MNHWAAMLIGMGVASLLLALAIFRDAQRPTIFSRAGVAHEPPSRWERASIYFVVYPVWSLVFGAVLWRGVPANAIDVRFAFEREWPVLEWAEWIYVSVYFVPLILPWLARRREDLRRFATDLWWLVGASALLYLALPLVVWPREFIPTTLAGRLLAWETARPDFAAAALPSFHVLWGLLGARLLAARGPAWALPGWSWAVAVAWACLATGTHALVDIVAAALLFPLLTAERSPLRRACYAGLVFLFNNRPRIRPANKPTPMPPAP